MSIFSGSTAYVPIMNCAYYDLYDKDNDVNYNLIATALHQFYDMDIIDTYKYTASMKPKNFILNGHKWVKRNYWNTYQCFDSRDKNTNLFDSLYDNWALNLIKNMYRFNGTSYNEVRESMENDVNQTNLSMRLPLAYNFFKSTEEIYNKLYCDLLHTKCPNAKGFIRYHSNSGYYFEKTFSPNGLSSPYKEEFTCINGKVIILVKAEQSGASSGSTGGRETYKITGAITVTSSDDTVIYEDTVSGSDLYADSAWNIKLSYKNLDLCTFSPLYTYEAEVQNDYDIDTKYTVVTSHPSKTHEVTYQHQVGVTSTGSAIYENETVEENWDYVSDEDGDTIGNITVGVIKHISANFPQCIIDKGVSANDYNNIKTESDNSVYGVNKEYSDTTPLFPIMAGDWYIEDVSPVNKAVKKALFKLTGTKKTLSNLTDSLKGNSDNVSEWQTNDTVDSAFFTLGTKLTFKDERNYEYCFRYFKHLHDMSKSLGNMIKVNWDGTVEITGSTSSNINNYWHLNSRSFYRTITPQYGAPYQEKINEVSDFNCHILGDNPYGNFFYFLIYNWEKIRYVRTRGYNRPSGVTWEVWGNKFHSNSSTKYYIQDTDDTRNFYYKNTSDFAKNSNCDTVYFVHWLSDDELEMVYVKNMECHIPIIQSIFTDDTDDDTERVLFRSYLGKTLCKSLKLDKDDDGYCTNDIISGDVPSISFLIPFDYNVYKSCSTKAQYEIGKYFYQVIITDWKIEKVHTKWYKTNFMSQVISAFSTLAMIVGVVIMIFCPPAGLALANMSLATALVLVSTVMLSSIVIEYAAKHWGVLGALMVAIAMSVLGQTGSIYQTMETLLTDLTRSLTSGKFLFNLTTTVANAYSTATSVSVSKITEEIASITTEANAYSKEMENKYAELNKLNSNLVENSNQYINNTLYALSKNPYTFEKVAYRGYDISEMYDEYIKLNLVDIQPYYDMYELPLKDDYFLS